MKISRVSVLSALSIFSLLAVPITAAPAKGKAPIKGKASAITKTPLTRKPGTIRGRCLNGAGKPLSGVRIRIYGTTQAGVKGSFSVTTDASGLYSLAVPNGIYNVQTAEYPVPAPAGPPYSLPLYPNDGSVDDAPSAPGIVENFTLKVSGRMTPLNDPDNDLSYYGGSIRISGGNLEKGNFLDGYTYRFPAGSTVEVTLVPQGPLIDGSPSKTLTFMRKGAASVDRINDVPIAKYQVTAQLIEADGTKKPLRVAVARLGKGTSPTHFTPAPSEFGASGILYFPSSGDGNPVLKLPGVSYAELYVQP